MSHDGAVAEITALRVHCGLKKPNASLDAIAEAYLAKYGCSSCWGDCHDCTCASDKAVIRGFVEHLKANTY